MPVALRSVVSRLDASLFHWVIAHRSSLLNQTMIILGHGGALVWAIGAGAELRQALGTAVFTGMLGVTALGLFLTPVFYVLLRHARVAAAPVDEHLASAVHRA